jgi:mRNA interferase RelE/StbE
MVCYKIEWKNSAKKELKRLPRQVIAKVISAVEKLPNNLCPIGSKKLVGTEHTYRLRTGDYRIVYSIQNDRLIIEIIRVAHRKDIYKK